MVTEGPVAALFGRKGPRSVTDVDSARARGRGRIGRDPYQFRTGDRRMPGPCHGGGGRGGRIMQGEHDRVWEEGREAILHGHERPYRGEIPDGMVTDVEFYSSGGNLVGRGRPAEVSIDQ